MSFFPAPAVRDSRGDGVIFVALWVAIPVSMFLWLLGSLLVWRAIELAQVIA